MAILFRGAYVFLFLYFVSGTKVDQHSNLCLHRDPRRQYDQSGGSENSGVFQFPILDWFSYTIPELHANIIQFFHDIVERVVGLLSTER